MQHVIKEYLAIRIALELEVFTRVYQKLQKCPDMKTIRTHLAHSLLLACSGKVHFRTSLSA